MRGRPFDAAAVTSPPLRSGWRCAAGPGAYTSPLPLSLQERGSPRPCHCAHPNPRPASKPRGFAPIPPKGDARSRVARVLAACRCRVSMSRCRCSADLAPPVGRHGRSSLTRGLTAARPPGAPARNGDASRNPPPHPAARCLATAPLVGCSGGRIGAGGAAGIRERGYARWGPVEPRTLNVRRKALISG